MTAKRPTHVIVAAGLAGAKAAETLRSQGFYADNDIEHRVGTRTDSSATTHERAPSSLPWPAEAERPVPLVDEDRTVANLYGTIHPNAIETATVRTVFIIGPDKKIKLTLAYPRRSVATSLKSFARSTRCS